jgi:hypothetical protein
MATDSSKHFFSKFSEASEITSSFLDDFMLLEAFQKQDKLGFAFTKH